MSQNKFQPILFNHSRENWGQSLGQTDIQTEWQNLDTIYSELGPSADSRAPTPVFYLSANIWKTRAPTLLFTKYYEFFSTVNYLRLSTKCYLPYIICLTYVISHILFFVPFILNFLFSIVIIYRLFPDLLSGPVS